MDRSPSSPDPERIHSLWSAAGVPAGEAVKAPVDPAAGRIRFGAPAEPAPAPASAAPASGTPPAPPPRGAAQPQPSAGRPAIPLPPAGARSPAPAAAQPIPPPPPRPAPLPPALTDEALAQQIFGPSLTGIGPRLQRLLEWLARSLSATAAFVADAEGLTIANLRTPEAYVAVSAPLGGLQEKLSSFVPTAPDGSTFVELEDQTVLQVIWTPTEQGRLALGMVLPLPLERSAGKRLRRLLQLAVDTKGKS